MIVLVRFFVIIIVLYLWFEGGEECSHVDHGSTHNTVVTVMHVAVE